MRAWAIVLGLSAIGLLTMGMVAARPDDKTSRADNAALEKDLAMIQGTWVYTERVGLFSSRRIVKEIKGTRETVTYYDTDGNVTRAHTVDVRLTREGRVRIFNYANMQFTEGPDKGKKTDDAFSYLYTVKDKDTFVEIWGMQVGEEKGDITLKEWKRVKAD